MPIVTAKLENSPRPHFQEIIGHSSTTRALWHQYPSLEIINGLLYRGFEHPSGIAEFARFQLVLPGKHVENTIKYYHGSLACGQHYGKEKTLALLKRYFYWPSMFDTVYEIVSSCETCFKTKGPTHRVKPPLKLFRDGVLHGRWHLDFCGPFVETANKYKYILVAVEAFSCWPVAVPKKNTNIVRSGRKISRTCVFYFWSTFNHCI